MIRILSGVIKGTDRHQRNHQWSNQLIRTSIFTASLVCFLAGYAPQAVAIQTDAFPDAQPLELMKAALQTYENARASLTAAIGEFRKLSQTAAKTPTPGQAAALKKALQTIRGQARVIHSLSKANGNKFGMEIAERMIIDDDITGDQAAVGAAAKLLDDLNSKFGLLEPVVYR